MCGCRGKNNNSQSIRNTTNSNAATNTPANAAMNAAVNIRVVAAANVRPVANPQQNIAPITRPAGMTKEQRDAERKKRIQLILKMKNQ